MKFLTLIILSYTLSSCSELPKSKKKHPFPFPVDYLIESRNSGFYIEWATLDHDFIDSIKILICDSLEDDQDMTIQKIRIETPSNSDSSYNSFIYFSYINEGSGCGITRKSRMFNLNLDKSDSFFWNYNQYHINKMPIIADSMSAYFNLPLNKIIENDSIAGKFIPIFHIEIEANSFSCNDHFIEKIIHLDSLIKIQMDILSNKIYSKPNKISPDISIRKKD